MFSLGVIGSRFTGAFDWGDNLGLIQDDWANKFFHEATRSELHVTLRGGEVSSALLEGVLHLRRLVVDVKPAKIYERDFISLTEALQHDVEHFIDNHPDVFSDIAHVDRYV